VHSQAKASETNQGDSRTLPLIHVGRAGVTCICSRVTRIHIHIRVGIRIRIYMRKGQGPLSENLFKMIECGASLHIILFVVTSHETERLVQQVIFWKPSGACVDNRVICCSRVCVCVSTRVRRRRRTVVGTGTVVTVTSR
jgi:hypothetical protein